MAISRITIEFETVNAAFEDAFSEEVLYVTCQAAAKITTRLRTGEAVADLRDSNGNRIGTVTVAEED